MESMIIVAILAVVFGGFVASASADPFGFSPVITVTSPNGGENLVWGNTYTIVWNDTGFSSNVSSPAYEVSLYMQDGVRISGVIGNVEGNTSLSWATGSFLTGAGGHLIGYGAGSYKIQVVRTDWADEWDQSDNSFNIISPINVTSPNGGETWVVGNTYHITWTTIGDIPEVQIGLRDTRFCSETNGEATIAYRIPNTGSYDFTVPDSMEYLGNGSLGGDSYEVIVYPWSGSIGDLSDTTFAIVPEPATMGLLGFGALGIVTRRRRRSRAKAKDGQ